MSGAHKTVNRCSAVPVLVALPFYDKLQVNSSTKLNLEVLVYMDGKRKKRSKGMGMVSTLVTLFIILKLTKVISWSWFLVFSPIWSTMIIAIAVFGSILVAGRIIKGKR